jgi:hypothetical protein
VGAALGIVTGLECSVALKKTRPLKGTVSLG